MKKSETAQQRAQRILKELAKHYPGKNAFAMNNKNLHFACEIEPATDHPEFDRCIEVVIQSEPHFHRKMTQSYTIIRGKLELHIDNKTVILQEGDGYVVKPNQIHWAKGIDCECWYENYSTPGWTPDDHILASEE